MYNFSYVIMENLRAFLYQMSPKAPVYFGSKFKPHVRQVSNILIISLLYFLLTFIFFRVICPVEPVMF